MKPPPTKYPPAVDEVIWALLCDRVGPSDILRKLHANEGQILERECPMPERTLFDHIRRLKAKRGDPEAHVKPGQEVDAADSIRRRALEMLNAELRDLDEQRKRKPLTTAEIAKLDRIGRAAAEHKRIAQGPTKNAGKGKRNADKDLAKGPTLTDRLSARLTSQEDEPAQSGVHPLATDTGTADTDITQDTEPTGDEQQNELGTIAQPDPHPLSPVPSAG